MKYIDSKTGLFLIRVIKTCLQRFENSTNPDIMFERDHYVEEDNHKRNSYKMKFC